MDPLTAQQIKRRVETKHVALAHHTALDFCATAANLAPNLTHCVVWMRVPWNVYIYIYGYVTLCWWAFLLPQSTHTARGVELGGRAGRRLSGSLECERQSRPLQDPVRKTLQHTTTDTPTHNIQWVMAVCVYVPANRVEYDARTLPSLHSIGSCLVDLFTPRSQKRGIPSRSIKHAKSEAAPLGLLVEDNTQGVQKLCLMYCS